MDDQKVICRWGKLRDCSKAGISILEGREARIVWVQTCWLCHLEPESESYGPERALTLMYHQKTLLLYPREQKRDEIHFWTLVILDFIYPRILIYQQGDKWRQSCSHGIKVRPCNNVALKVWKEETKTVFICKPIIIPFKSMVTQYV